MDPKTLRVLEYDKIVVRLAGHAAFDVGRELALALRPSADVFEVRARQALTREARAFLDRRDGATLDGAQDVRAAVAGAARGRVLQPAELLGVRATLAVARRLKRAIAHDDARWPGLALLAGRIDPCPAVHDAIGDALDEAGEVLDSASPELRRVRRQLKIVHDRIVRQLQALVKGAAREYLQDALVTQRNGRWVVPLKADFRSRVPGVVHDTSDSGATLFVEPLAVVDHGNAHRELAVSEQREIERVLRALSEAVAVEADGIAGTVAALGAFDLAFAAAQYGRELRAVTPEILDAAAPMLRCEAARHPLLDGATVVPIGVRIGDDFRLMVITGPNTGGKTVTLKTVGLLALMAQAGLQVPCADGAQLAVFDAVYADIGDEQSIEQSLSTFSGHLTNIVRILHDATPRSLVLLDELGAGTDPTEGAAIAGAILEALRARGVATVASSHFTELKAYAYGTPGVANASVEFDLETLRPTYELTIGLPGRSNALAIAERLGLPAAIVEAARGGLATSAVEMEELLADIRAARRSALQDRAAATEQRQAADRWAAELEEGVDRLAAERAAVLQTTRAQAQDELEAAREAIARLLKRAERAAALARAGTVVVEASGAGAGAAGAVSAAELAAERAEILGGLAKIEDILAAESERQGVAADADDWSPGDSVRVRSFGQPATLLSVDGDTAQVQLGRMRMSVALDDLEFVATAPSEPPPAPASRGKRGSSMPLAPEPAAGSGPATEVDVRGLRVEEALDIVDTRIDRALLQGAPWLRIIHGHGTGALKTALRKRLTANRSVKRHRPGDRTEGGDGATVVYFD
ncbi:MAG: Smr/MutS family protein [Ardenticatenales bacterium]|nr:Smr/MutS family protein [Ardenticatenales bacterium]